MSYCVPETILKGVFDLINQIRGEYHLNQLQFSKELSFLAGEHACNMSTLKVPYGHAGFVERMNAAPLAINFSENVCYLRNSENPCQDFIMKWVSKSSTKSRMLGSYTHTGIGVAESDDGEWYCTQIFATYRLKQNQKDMLLIIARLANRIRTRNQQLGLAISPVATSRLISKIEEHSDAIFALTPSSVKTMFINASESEYISESIDLSESPDYLTKFMQIVDEQSNYKRIIRKEYTDIGFARKRVSSNTVVCVIILAKCSKKYKKVPQLHMHYPFAWKCSLIVNDYRESHGLQPLTLSHQFSRIAEHYAKEMMNKVADLEISTITKRIEKKMTNSKVHCGIAIVPMSMDPIPELFLQWISIKKAREAILIENATYFGFGISVLDNKICYATRIIGNKPNPTAATSMESMDEAPSKTVEEPLYLTLTSDEDEGEELYHDASSSFHLTG